MHFTKMEGLGNDYVYVDCFEQHVNDPVALAKRVSDRRFGIGSDGLILIRPSDTADVAMEMYNADGSRGRMCGNGIRCVARYAFESGLAPKHSMVIDTDAGEKSLDLVFANGAFDGVRVDMGAPVFERADIPMEGPEGRVVAEYLSIQDHGLNVTCLSMGNPHCVTFVEDVEAFGVRRWGQAIEQLPIFPERVNVEFVQVVSESLAIQRTWERGSGETHACGTGACAVAVAGQVNGLLGNDVTVRLKGGDLRVEWAGGDHDSVFMTGPAIEVFRGTLDL